METIISAMIGLIGVVLGALITSFAPELKQFIRKNTNKQVGRGSVICPLEVFGTRTSSDNAMITDICLHDKVAFIGISHRHLSTYLKNLITRFEDGKKLVCVDIYYASSDDGKLWERERFVSNVSRTRQEIAELITDPRWGTQKITNLHFWQTTHHSTYGGCIIGENSNSILYVVNYLPTPNPDAKDSLTFRITPDSRNDKCLEEFARNYISGYQFIRQKAVDLGLFIPSIWDISANEWKNFSSICLAHQNSMRHLCALASLTGEENAIDVACGDGTTSKILHEYIPRGRLTVLDTSPQMLLSAKSSLPTTVGFSLQFVPPREEGIQIDISPPYDIAFIHLSFPSVGDSLKSLAKLSKWCSSILKPNGRVAVAVHNTAVHISGDEYKISDDPLRVAIRNFANNDPTLTYRPKQKVVLEPRIIEEAFTGSGFSILKMDEMNFAMTMSDRVAMWNTPAVLDELIDVSSTTFEKRSELMNLVTATVQNTSTPPMKVKYWIFQL